MRPRESPHAKAKRARIGRRGYCWQRARVVNHLSAALQGKPTGLATTSCGRIRIFGAPRTARCRRDGDRGVRASSPWPSRRLRAYRSTNDEPRSCARAAGGAPAESGISASNIAMAGQIVTYGSMCAARLGSAQEAPRLHRQLVGTAGGRAGTDRMYAHWEQVLYD